MHSLENKEIPSEIRGWNWGAFFLSWIWGLGNNTYIALLALIPIVNLVFIFILGAKGNEWAWKNKNWKSVEDFKDAQRKWRNAGWIVWGISILIVLAVIIGAASERPRIILRRHISHRSRQLNPCRKHHKQKLRNSSLGVHQINHNLRKVRQTRVQRSNNHQKTVLPPRLGQHHTTQRSWNHILRVSITPITTLRLIIKLTLQILPNTFLLALKNIQSAIFIHGERCICRFLVRINMKQTTQ